MRINKRPGFVKVFAFLAFLLFELQVDAQAPDLAEAYITKRDSLKKGYQVYFPILIDPGLTMRAGVDNITTLHKGISALEDKIIGTSWFSESRVVGKAGGIVGRLAKFVLLDVPVDYFSVVLAHEYFGHGARYREFDINNVYYSFDWPPPYGQGGGEATNSQQIPISTHELLAIWEGGVESHPLIGKSLGLRWMMKNEMSYREASQYFWSFQIMHTYIQDTNEALDNGESDNDPRAYVRIINALNGYPDVNNLKMDVHDLKSKMMVNVAHPFILYSMYSILKTYLWEGEMTNKVPSLHIGDTYYLPGFRANLTPFGVEYHMDNYLRFKNKVALIDIRYGDRTFHGFWGGLGAHIQNIYELRNFSFDGKLDVWKQPQLQLESNLAQSKGGGIGAALSIRSYYNLYNSQLPISFVLELGHKSTGFIQGYKLDSTPIIMFGLALRN